MNGLCECEKRYLRKVIMRYVFLRFYLVVVLLIGLYHKNGEKRCKPVIKSCLSFDVQHFRKWLKDINRQGEHLRYVEIV